MPQQEKQYIINNSPFQLDNKDAYESWRQQKQPDMLPTLSDLFVDIKDPYHLSNEEQATILTLCERFNMALYSLNDSETQDKTLVHSLGRQLGLLHLDANLRSDEDSVSSLEVREQAGNQYIPYTDKALSWHTDGYYNQLDKQIFAIIMHCVRPAADGGVNSLLNPEQVYIALRDEDPAYIEALMHPEAMTIPENIESGKVIRKAQAGPVFMLRPGTGRLHMRYSARKRNIIWRQTQATQDAVAMINEMLANDDNVVKVGLEAGQGIICNNVLHNRSSFTDSDTQKRWMYRARYYDSVKMKNEK